MEKMAEKMLEGYELKLNNPMLRRGFMMLEDGEFDEAKEQFDKVLDDAPECAEAYVGKLLAEFKLGDISLLATVKEPFEDKPAYRRAVKYADEKLGEYLKGCAIATLEGYEAGDREEKPAKVVEVVDENLNFSKNGDGYVVVACNPHAYEATIPSTYNGLPVVGIGKNAFQYCDKLKKLVIPDSLTFIEEFAFRDCSGKFDIYITDIQSWCNILNISEVPRGGNIYLNGKRITKLVIPDGVTSIGNWAFSRCKGLTSITIPDSVTSIGDHAFEGCERLTNITIPDSVTSIGYEAFRICTGLTSVTIPDSVTSIGERAFSRCEGLTSITIPDSVTSIGERAFHGCTGLTSITIPDSVTSIKRGTFDGCRNLKSITIPDSVTSIGERAFHGCTGLTSITIPDSVTSIGAYALSNRSNIFYCGTKQEWKKLEYESDNVYFYSEKKTFLGGKQWHYVDGVPTKW